MNNKLIVSLYDYTHTWSDPYIKAGYPVMLWDKKVEGCILEGFSYLMQQIEDTGLQVYGVLAAVPCTDIAGSGARWWKEKDKPAPGYFPFDSTTELSTALVEITLHFVDLFKPKFWTLENPVGRMETLVPEIKAYRKMSFDPCDFGDPYTKKTILWGEFNTDLKKVPVLPLYGSLMHSIPPSDKRQEIRSVTPKGFSNAFFQANQ